MLPKHIKLPIIKYVKQHERVERKLTERILTMKNIRQIIGINRSQLNYWDVQGLFNKRKVAGKKFWRRFSRIDLVVLMILDKLADYGLQLSDLCENPLELYATAIKQFNVVEQFSKGNRVYLYLDGTNINYFFGDEMDMWKKSILQTSDPVTVIRTDPIMRKVLRLTQKDDFFIRYIGDEFGGKHKIVYYVEGERIVLEGKIKIRRRRQNEQQ